MLDKIRYNYDIWYDSIVASVTRANPSMTEQSRYRDMSTLHSMRNGSHLQFARKDFFRFDASDTSYFVSSATAYRPDIISVEMYGDPRYAWAIIAANKMKSFFDLHSDQYIIIPTLMEVTTALGEE